MRSNIIDDDANLPVHRIPEIGFMPPCIYRVDRSLEDEDAEAEIESDALDDDGPPGPTDKEKEDSGGGVCNFPAGGV